MPRNRLMLLAAAALISACSSVAPATTGLTSTRLPTAPSTLAAPSASAAPTAEPTDDCVARTLQAMTEEQRIGQLFLLGIQGDTLSKAETDAIQTYHLGSVWLVHERTKGIDGVRPLTDKIQALATSSTTGAVGFFVGADQEGGLIQRITGPGFSTIPAAIDQGALSPDVLQSDATTWGLQLKAAGVNLNFAPVMDVVPPGTDATNAPIGALRREFGHDPAIVSSHGAAVVTGMERAGVATSLKHFPGLGRVVGNTDTVSGVTDPVTTSEDPYLEPFRAGIAAGVPMVMVSLATYARIDPARPAVFSSTVIGRLLRNGLGFRGVVVSDDLGAARSVAAMPAGARALEFIAAGGDLIVVNGTAPAIAMAAAVSSRAASDAAFRSQVDAAALLVVRAKAAYGLPTCAP